MADCAPAPFGALLAGHYGAVLVDPPWHFRARTALQVGNWTSRRDAGMFADIAAAETTAASGTLFGWAEEGGHRQGRGI